MAAPGEMSAPLHGEGGRQPMARVLASIARNAIPGILTNLLGFVNETTNAVFIGHYGNTEALAAVGIGNMLQNCCGLSIGIGLCSALDTLVSQAHGAGEDGLACVYLQRARVITTLQMLWILPVLIWSDQWLVAIGQDPVVARYAAEYNAVSAPFLVFWFQASASRRFLSAMLRPKAGVVVGAICAIFHVLWCTIFVAHLGLGNRGLGLANGLSWTLRALLFNVYLWWVTPELGLQRKSVLGLQKDAFRGWWDYMRTAFPALVATCSEWWFWEICALFVGYLGSEALAAHVTAQNIMTLVYMVPLGISSAASTLCGNALGARCPTLAKQTAWLSVRCMVFVWLALSVSVTLFRGAIAGAFTKDPAVQQLTITLLMLNLWTSGFLDSSSNVLGGVCRGIRKLKAVSSVFLVSYYGIMLPIALLMAFPLRLGVKGLYYAMSFGTGASLTAFLVVLLRADWPALAEAAASRVSRQAREVRASGSPQERELPSARDESAGAGEEKA